MDSKQSCVFALADSATRWLTQESAQQEAVFTSNWFFVRHRLMLRAGTTGGQDAMRDLPETCPGAQTDSSDSLVSCWIVGNEGICPVRCLQSVHDYEISTVRGQRTAQPTQFHVSPPSLITASKWKRPVWSERRKWVQQLKRKLWIVDKMLKLQTNQ